MATRPQDQMGETNEIEEPEVEEALPPMFKSWNQMYAFVLIMHVVIIILFYLFTRAYS
ncbi:MAG TPA: hypothetical protein VJ953_10710 [Saprospiraceae bacterium]|nr:hypothetical protein [Saprospiraceae bacterium]